MERVAVMTPLPDSDRSRRVYPLLQNQDLENVSQATLKSVGDPISIESLNEDELRKLVLVNLARLSVKSEWNGLLTAGGGSSGSTFGDYLMTEPIASSYNRYLVTGQPPWGSIIKGSTEWYGNDNSDKVFFVPFIAPESGDVTSLGVHVYTAASSSCNLQVGIYDSNSKGAPDTLQTKGEMDMTSTGNKYDTSLSGGTATLVKGDMYWAAFVRDTADEGFKLTAQVTVYQSMPFAWVDSPSSGNSNNMMRLNGSDLALPAGSITFGNFYPNGNYPPSLTMKIA